MGCTTQALGQQAYRGGELEYFKDARAGYKVHVRTLNNKIVVIQPSTPEVLQLGNHMYGNGPEKTRKHMLEISKATTNASVMRRSPPEDVNQCKTAAQEFRSRQSNMKDIQ